MRERPALNAALVVLAAVPLVLTIVDFVLAQGNYALRTEVARRQHAIGEGAQLARVTQALIREIAVTAVKGKDDKLRELLSKNGITVKVNPAPPSSGDGRGG
jgi:hypothetical protein